MLRRKAIVLYSTISNGTELLTFNVASQNNKETVYRGFELLCKQMYDTMHESDICDLTCKLLSV